METLDKDVVNLAKAIRQHESGGDFNIKGKSGEHGGYQFMPETWKGYAKETLGDENAPMTPENQNQVAYKKIKQWKDKGYNPGQIASMWNAGEGKPNAYLEGHAGVNKFGVKYDTPTYAKKVAEYYQQFKQESGGTPVANAQGVTPKEEKPKKDLLQKSADIVSSIFPGKQVGEAIGTLGGYIATPKENRKFYDLSAPTPLQVAGDVAQGALTVGAGLPAGGATSALGKGLLGKATGFATKTSNLGKLAQGTKLGGYLGLTEGIKQGDEAGEVLKKGGLGAIAGGVLTGAGIGLSKLTSYLPERLIPFKTKDVKYAASKKLGSPEKMLSRSDAELATLGNKLGSVLSSPKYKGVTVTGGDIYPKILADLPDAGLTPDELIKEMTKLGGVKKGLIQRLFSPQGLSLEELQRLNSEIGKNTYKTVFDTPETKAGKQIGNAFYHAVGDAIRAIAKEDKVDAIYKNMSKEYLLNNALTKYVNKVGGNAPINLTDLVSFDVGGLPFAVGRKILTSPTTQLRTAGLIKSLGGETSKNITKGIRAPLIKGIIGE